jgi:hypothetical protein
MSRRLLALAGVLIATVATVLMNWGGPARVAVVPASGPPPVSAVPAGPAVGGRGFRTQALLAVHFQKHGAEFGQISIAEYVREAQALRDRPAGGAVLELVRGDGTITRFDRISGAFIAFERDGTIRTFFKPNQGEAYFRRQARRAAGEEDKR